MAIQKETEFIGTIDNLIYYKWMDKYCIRTTPKQMRQSEATKRAAKVFGIASSRSKIIRQLLAPALTDPNDKILHSRLRNALIAALSRSNEEAESTATHPLKGFSFNDSLPLSEGIKFPIRIFPEDSTKIKIEIAAFDPQSTIVAPAGTTRVQVDFTIARFSFDDMQAFRSEFATLNIAFTEALEPPRVLDLEDPGDEPGVLMIVAALSYWKDSNRMTGGAYQPVEVMAVYKRGREGSLA
ncbi:hypothetical protein GZH53_12800 [Flavihumibacter sp. R14]|nr:hypothetical protein [Flavihumibacter soli]